MTANRSSVLVSIGMPVFNEARYIDAALLSLRAQTEANIEIIVCDNASTDGTAAICRKHADEDVRINLNVSEMNVGSAENFKRALNLASGEYFMWASGHDLWSRDLVSECVRLLQHNPNACLAFGSTLWIGADGEPLPYQSGWTDTRGLSPLARFFTVLWGSMNPVLGVFRTQALRQAGLRSIVGSDLVLLSELSLRHEFLHARTAEWFRRETRLETSHADRTKRYASAEFGAARSRLSRIAPLLALPLAMLGVIVRSELGWLDKIGAFVVLAPAMVLRYRVGKNNPRRFS